MATVRIRDGNNNNNNNRINPKKQAGKKGTMSEDEFNECIICKKKVANLQPAVNCEICEFWFHIACADIPKEVYDFLVKDETGEQFHWNCSACNRGYKNMKKSMDQLANRQTNIEISVGDIKQKVSRLEAVGQSLEAMKLQLGDVFTCFEDVKQIEARVGSLEAVVMSSSEDQSGRPSAEDISELQSRIRVLEDMPRPYPNSQAQSTPPGQEVDVIEELNERKAREKNIIVFGVTESREQDIEARRIKDKDLMCKLLADCNVVINDQSELARVARLGRPATDRQRPILIAFRNIGSKQALFTNIRLLRNKPQWQDVRIANDMTPAEREKEKVLRDQAKNLEREGKGKHTVRGPPWRRRVVKSQEGTQ